MDGIQWDEVKDNSLKSLKSVILSASTSRRCQGLHDLHEKFAGRVIWETERLFAMDSLTIFKAMNCQEKLTDPFCSYYSKLILFTSTAPLVGLPSDVSAISFPRRSPKPTSNIFLRSYGLKHQIRRLHPQMLSFW